MLKTQENPQPGNAGWQALMVEIHPILVIMRREIIDTMRDWRIVFPIVVLVLGFPFLANFAASQGVDFVNQYGANIIMERLLPFLMLVVGFFPSSFSLVIALETFMGEKERRSLEPLLATPLTDLQLYLGKLLAATVPPVFASYLGMIFYIILLAFSMNWRPEPALMLLAFVLATAEALVMVTGAVVVSSQSTSVRAANLLASFIIIPMAFLLQAEASMLLFANYTALWLVVAFLLVVNTLLIRLGLRIFDREHLLGRDIDTVDLGKSWRTFRAAAWPKRNVASLYRKEIPALLRGIWPELLITALVIMVGGLLVGAWANRVYALPPGVLTFAHVKDVETIYEAVAKTGIIGSLTPGNIFFHNVRSLIGGALMAIFSMGVLAILLLAAPVAVIFYIVMQVGGTTDVNPWLFLAVFILPHGILELPAAIIATAQAMRMGDIILMPPEKGGGVTGIVRELGHFVKILVALVLPLLFAAAWIEARITPHLVVRFFGS